MNFWILVVLCLIQGLTEFLPVSSSGHLLLFEEIFNINENTLFLNLFLHLATLLAVIIVYRKTILNLIKKPLQPFTYKLLLSTIITVLFAILYNILNLDNIAPYLYGFFFIITAFLLSLAHIYQKKIISKNNREISIKNAAIVGIIQGFAVMPGLSRSGSTISSLMLLGENKQKACEYSFLLSIPIIIGGFLLEVIKIDNWQSIFSFISPPQIIFAFVFTFIVSFISLKATIKLLKNNYFIYFAVYLFIIGILVTLFKFII